MVVGFPTNDFKQELATKTSAMGAAADSLYKQLNEATGQPPR